jgi:hypothetical protein
MIKANKTDQLKRTDLTSTKKLPSQVSPARSRGGNCVTIKYSFNLSIIYASLNCE